MADDRSPLAWIAVGGALSVALSLGLAILVIGSCSDQSPVEPGAGNVLFQDDFESGLGKWVGRPSGNNAQLVPDPLGTRGSVAHFTQSIANGDIFTSAIELSADSTYVLSFDYLGLTASTVPAGGLGGFIGIADDITFPTSLAWIAGTQPDQVDSLLIDDGAWHSYSISFVPSQFISMTGGTLRVMLEDFEGSGAYAADAEPGDAYFDNVRLTRPD